MLDVVEGWDFKQSYCIWANKKLEMVDDKGIQEYTNGVFGEEISGFCIKNIKKCIYIIYFYCKKS